METNSCLRVLIVEDDENDQFLIKREFKKGGLGSDFHCVKTKKGLTEALNDGEWDVMISDHNLPDLTSVEVLHIVRQRGLDMPFLAVSGGAGVETVVELLQNGAYDCIMKGDLARLVPSVKNALNELRLRKEHSEAEKALYESHRQLEDALNRLKENQTRLIQTEKMASLGQLAAGIAHEINNPLGYVSTNLDMLQHYVALLESTLDLYERLAEHVRNHNATEIEDILGKIEFIKAQNKFDYIREDLGNLLKETQEGLNRINDLTQRLKIFVHSDQDKRQLFSVNESVETALKLTWNELKYKCEIKKDLGVVPLVPCHPGRLSQVFMNLLINASHAIRDKGKITISTGSEEDHVFVKIADTGEGIKQEHLGKIFTPFFTTKPSGLGTGLGLSISHGIIKEHGGEIEVESEEGLGTSFTVRLPLVMLVSVDAQPPSET